MLLKTGGLERVLAAIPFLDITFFAGARGSGIVIESITEEVEESGTFQVGQDIGYVGQTKEHRHIKMSRCQNEVTT